MAFDPITGAEDLFKSIVGLGQTYIDNKEKAAEFAFQLAQLQVQFSQQLVQTKTSPFVDALVKFMYAMRDVIIPMFRPIGSFLLTASCAYLNYKQIAPPEPINSIMASSFPGWMVSRHINKQTELTKNGA